MALDAESAAASLTGLLEQRSMGFADADENSFSALDERTLEIETTAPSPFLRGTLVPPVTALHYREDEDRKGPIGTGPFQTGKITPGDPITTTAYDDYYGDPSKFDELVFKGIPDDTTRTSVIRSGEEVSLILSAGSPSRKQIAEYLQQQFGDIGVDVSLRVLEPASYFDKFINGESNLVLVLQFGYLLNGAVVLEIVFARPGLGRLLLDAIFARDYPIVRGTALVIAVVFVLVNFLVDVAYRYIDPRIDLEGRAP